MRRETVSIQVLLGHDSDLGGNDLELRHLRYFVAVAEAEHVGKAAERLHVSPSPLSRQIRQLESELEVRLFERRGRGVRLTEAGRAFLAGARRSLETVDRAASEARSVARGESGRLSIAFSDTPPLARLVPEVISQLRNLRPGVALEVTPLDSHAQLEALRAREIDVGFGHEPPTDALFRAEPLYPERVLLAIPEGHPLAGVKTLRAKMLSDQPFVWPRGPKPFLLAEVENALRAKGVALRVVLEAHSSSETRLSLVASGMGLTFALESNQTHLPPRVLLREVSDLRIDGNAYLVCREEEAHAPAIRLVRKLTRAARRRLLP